MADGINVGDATLKFLADTTALDAAYDKVNREVPTKLAPADAATEKLKTTFMGFDTVVDTSKVTIDGFTKTLYEVPPAVQEVNVSMAEAKGTIALVGEEVGIRVPRHIRSFLAEMPGVGAALESAFSGVAVLILIQLLVEGAKKLSEFTAELAFNTKGAEENMKSTASLNTVLVTLQKQYEELKKKADEYGKSAVELANLNENQAKKSVEHLNEQLKLQIKHLQDLNGEEAFQKIGVAGVIDAYSAWKSGAMSLTQALGAALDGTAAMTLHEKELTKAQEAVVKTAAELKAAKEREIVAHHDTTDAVKKHNEELAKLRAREADVFDALSKANREFEEQHKILASNLIPDLPVAAAELQKLGAAMRLTGSSTIDLELKVLAQSKAVDIIHNAMQRGAVGVRQYQVSLLSLRQTELELAKATGADTAALEKQIKVLQKSIGIDKQKDLSLVKLTKEEQIFAQRLKDTGSIAQASSAVMGEAMGSAVAAYAMGQASIGQSLAKMVEQELASVSQRATIKAIEQLALGFGTMFTNPPESSSHFASAAIWGTIGAASAVAGNAMSGAAGGKDKPGSVGNPINTTTSMSNGVGSSSGPATVANAQSFAVGGLITKPTLAVIGDNPSGKGELAIPLGDPKAKAAMQDAMGGAPHIAVNVRGMVSPDNLKKVVKNLNRMVRKNQVPLQSSQTMRITRRSS